MGPKHLVEGTVHSRVQRPVAEGRTANAQDHNVLEPPLLFFRIGQKAIMPSTPGGQGLEAKVILRSASHSREGRPGRAVQGLQALFRDAVFRANGVGGNVRPVD
jgi:hypothetical protein